MTRKINFITKALLFAVFIATFLSASAQKNYTYQTVVDDPMLCASTPSITGLKCT